MGNRSKINYANHLTKETTLISGHAEESEPGALALAQSRLQTAYALLEELGFTRDHQEERPRLFAWRRGQWTACGNFLPARLPNKCCDGE